MTTRKKKIFQASVTYFYLFLFTGSLVGPAELVHELGDGLAEDIVVIQKELSEFVVVLFVQRLAVDLERRQTAHLLNQIVPNVLCDFLPRRSRRQGATTEGTGEDAQRVGTVVLDQGILA